MYLKVEPSLPALLNDIQIDSQISLQSIYDFPQELILQIFQFLSLHDLAAIRLVGHKWKILASDPTTIF